MPESLIPAGYGTISVLAHMSVQLASAARAGARWRAVFYERPHSSSRTDSNCFPRHVARVAVDLVNAVMQGAIEKEKTTGIVQAS